MVLCSTVKGLFEPSAPEDFKLEWKEQSQQDADEVEKAAVARSMSVWIGGTRSGGRN